MIMCSSCAASASSHHRCSRCATTTLGSVMHPLFDRSQGASPPYSIWTSMSFPVTRTGKLFTPRVAGGPTRAPVFTLNREPCHGHVTTSPAIDPSASGPPACGQVFSIAQKFPPALKMAMFCPPAEASLPVFRLSKSVLTPTFTNWGMEASFLLVHAEVLEAGVVAEAAVVALQVGRAKQLRKRSRVASRLRREG